MGRKAFVQDLEDAATVGTFAQIADVRAGADDGTVNFAFMSTALPTGVVMIEALVPEVSEYPGDHIYFLYTTSTSDHVPPCISTALESIQPSLSGCNLPQMLNQVSLSLQSSLSKGTAHDPIDLDDEEMEDQPEDGEANEEQDELLSQDSEDEDEHLWPPSSPQHDAPPISKTDGFSMSGIPSAKKVRARIRSDLRAAKRAGFKVGVLGDLNAGGFVCLSIRVVKLGISEEAMQAWGLRRQHYLVLMIRFEHGYRTLEQVSEESVSTATGKNKTEMRVALSERYKPSITDAINAFTQAAKSATQPLAGLSTPYAAAPSSLETVFIGRPLNDLLRERFAGIAKYRLACGFSWTGSETFFNDIQGKSLRSVDASHSRYSVADDTGSRALPRMVTADHIAETISGLNLSFPLVAMQFVLRHFVRCTEFCLVCHCRTEASFEALKPYVCSKPLCLYQYMALGFGPSIEWEIMAQPDVVDLLVSFCYTGAKGSRLREFPVGIDLRVPWLPQIQQADSVTYPNPPLPTLPARLTPSESTPKPAHDGSPASFITSLDPDKMELVFADRKGRCPVKVGDWVVIECKVLHGQTHTRVEETILWPVVRLQKNGICPSASSPATTTPSPATTPKALQSGLVDARIYIYNQSFDELSDSHKQLSIVTLLETLPAIYEMKEYLEHKQPGQEPTLKNWRERLSESTLNLFRWIIASNRSCIVQVGQARLPSAPRRSGTWSQTPAAGRSPAVAGAEDRVSGMANWMQFRFAQGAPDKEQRFIDCVNEVAARTRKAHPTLFAWHGSPLANWHSIVRQGLNYNETLHGRAYGHGVYMSAQCMTSMSYSNMYAGGYGRHHSDTNTVWPNSRLKISCALSLNEVVNAPQEFTSQSPHYVVDKIDWIQTRYLFLKVDAGVHVHSDASDSKPAHVYDQDQRVQALGEHNVPVVIPITAVSKSRRPALSPASLAQASSPKKIKSLKVTNQEIAEQEEDDAASLVTDDDDSRFLQSSDEEEPMLRREARPAVPSRTKRRGLETPPTDFVPGSLDVSQLKLLRPPINASSATTKTLLKALTQTLQVQQDTPAHELGWYVHGEQIDNVYQWIVEMHSFEATLPLAKDMKQAGLTSIVLEVRFTNQFPFSPPFVRVIRPRFTPFLAGGGGHVTAGGALCMELLTNDGWLLSTSMENVLLQVRMAISSTDPRPARLQAPAGYGGQAYGIGEAIDAYQRACRQHGWTPATDFDSLRESERVGR